MGDATHGPLNGQDQLLANAGLSLANSVSLEHWRFSCHSWPKQTSAWAANTHNTHTHTRLVLQDSCLSILFQPCKSLWRHFCHVTHGSSLRENAVRRLFPELQILIKAMLAAFRSAACLQLAAAALCARQSFLLMMVAWVLPGSPCDIV